MDMNEIYKTISPYVVSNEMTWDNFDKIFGFLLKKEQYPIAYNIEDDLKILLVDEIISRNAEEIPLIYSQVHEIKASNKIWLN